MILSVSTTCCFLPCGSAGTLEASLKSRGRGSHRRGALDQIGTGGETRGNASVFVQEPVNSAGRFWESQLLLFQGFIATQILEDGDADLVCDPSLLEDHPGSLRAGLPPLGRVSEVGDEGPGRVHATPAHHLW